MSSANEIKPNIPNEIDEIIYDVGHSCCWFNVRSGKHIISFRLFFDDIVWKLFMKAVDDDKKLFPYIKSSITFKFGSKEYKNVYYDAPWRNSLLRQVSKQNFIKIFDDYLQSNISNWKGLSYYGGDECYEII